MKPVNKAVRRMLIVSMLLTVALVAGIPSIVLGAVYRITALLCIGIVCTVCGFYGTPVAWTGYANRRGLARIVAAVVEEQLYQVPELAAQLSLSEKEVRGRLTVCFQRRYLQGFRRDGDIIVRNEGVVSERQEYAAECPSCGAKFMYTADRAYCPYCLTPAVRDKSVHKS